MRIWSILDLDHIYSITEEHISKKSNGINKNEGVMLWINFRYIHRLCSYLIKIGTVEI